MVMAFSALVAGHVATGTSDDVSYMCGAIREAPRAELDQGLGRWTKVPSGSSVCSAYFAVGARGCRPQADAGSTGGGRSSKKEQRAPPDSSQAGSAAWACCIVEASTPYAVVQASFTSVVKAGPRPRSSVHSNAPATVL